MFVFLNPQKKKKIPPIHIPVQKNTYICAQY